jgi:hypothetical protein
MEPKSPRAGQGARAGKSIAADDPAHNIPSALVPFKRIAGRDRTDGGMGYPGGCAALSPDIDAVCTAQLRRGAQCILCRREGVVPDPAESRFGISIVGHRSVQACRSWHHGCWLVSVFRGGRLLDGRFPVIACRSRADAEELALARARQLEPFAPIEARGSGDWRLGRTLVLVLGDGR